MDWLIANARLTVFFTDQLDITDSSWWEEVVGAPPDETSIKRAQGIRVDNGVTDGLKLVLQTSANRADWLLGPLTESAEIVFQTIGNFQSVAEFISQKFSNWLLTAENIKRIAIGSLAISPVDGKEEGYRYLQEYLPTVQLQPERMGDFIFRINRPVQVTVASTEILVNRVCKWSVLQRTNVTQTISPEGVANAALPESAFAATCDIDINTDAGRTAEFPADIRQEVINTLIKQGEMVLTDGDKLL